MAEEQVQTNTTNDNGGGKWVAPSYTFSGPTPNNFVTSPKAYNVDPALYDIDKIAYQSGAHNMWNSFIQGINQTQIGTSQYDLFVNRKRIADIEGGTTFKGELPRLESDFLAKRLTEDDYLTQKNQLLSELNGLYNDVSKIQTDILSDRSDINDAPVSKAYQIRQQLIQGQGSDAGFLDSLVYTQPSVMGSSAATLGTTVAVSFGSNFAKKVATRAAASVSTGPLSPFVATGLTLITIGGTLYAARDLESRAEVGGAIEEDYEQLKQNYLLETGKKEEELTPQEENELVNKAYAGADRQYWKNMSLAVVDAVQAMALGAGFSKWFNGIANTNKWTRAGARIGEFYIGAKSEALEEGLQYAFQRDKQNQALYGMNPEADSFIRSLGQDYVDVLGSMNYGPIKGNGKYSEDKEFQFATDAGFIMGALMGGSAGILRTSRDLYNYRAANQQLQKDGVRNIDGDIFKFKTDIYKSFFEPSTGMFGEEGSDRVHFLREAVKALGKKKDPNGQPILTQEEVQTELKNIGTAYRLYDKLDGYIDQIKPGFKSEDVKVYKLASAKFKDAIFRQAMETTRIKDSLSRSTQENEAAKLNIDIEDFPDLVDAKNYYDVVNNRIKTIKAQPLTEDIKSKRLAQLEKIRTSTLGWYNDLRASSAASGANLSTIKEANPDLVQSNEDILTNELFELDETEKYNDLLKIKSFKQLKDWFLNTAETEAKAGFNEALEALKNVRREEYTQAAQNRADFSTLTEDELNQRDKENQEVLAREGFTRNEIANMSAVERDTTVNGIIDAYTSGGVYVNQNRLLDASVRVKTQQELNGLLDLPGYPEFVQNTLGLPITATPAEVAAAAKLQIDAKSTPQTKKPLPQVNRGKYTSFGRLRSVTDERTAAEIEQEYNVNNNQADQATVLNAIIASPYSTPAEKELARQYLKVTEADDVIIFRDENVPGFYEVDSGTVVIDPRFAASDYASEAAIETVVLHELTHKYTVATLKADPDSDLSLRLNNLFNFVSNQARTKGTFDKFYGLSNPYEFISEAMTNPEFQSFLRDLSYEVTDTTAWQEFLNLVRAALKSLGINTDQTALDEVVSVTSGLVQRTNRESFTSIQARFNDRIDNEITSSKSLDENVTAAENLLADIYDTPGLSKAESSILETSLNKKLDAVQQVINAKDKSVIKFGKWSFKPGDLVTVADRKVIYTVVSKNEDGSVITSYKYTKDKKKSTASRVINEPSEITGVFTDRQAANDFIKQTTTPVARKAATTPTKTAAPNDSLDNALDDFIKYSQGKMNYGSLDPRLLELGGKLIAESIKIGKTNFRDISAEVITRRGEDIYKQIFSNLRAVYNGLAAETPGLNDSDEEILALVRGTTTAQSIIDSLNPPEAVVENAYTGSDSTVEEDRKLGVANVRDRESGELFKSTGQQYNVNALGEWEETIDTDPVKTRYYNFIDRLLAEGKKPSDLGYYGMVIQDSIEGSFNGVAIPHENNTIEWYNSMLEAGKKPTLGQIAIIVNRNGIPIRFDQNGNESQDGAAVVFNIESALTASKKDAEVVAKNYQITVEEATDRIRKSSNEVSAIRNSARSGNPVMIELTPKAGVMMVTEQTNSLSVLAGQNVVIDIPTVRKDDTNIGYFTTDPNATGFLGGAYVFVNGSPIKIEPNNLNEGAADTIIAILDAKTSDTAEKNARKKFLEQLVFQRFQPGRNAGEYNIYFKGSDVYLNGTKVPKGERKTVLTTHGRYNIVSNLLNKNWAPYLLKNGKIVKGSPIKYNSFILGRSSSKVQFTSEGKQRVANSYFTYTRAKAVPQSQPKEEEIVQQSSTTYQPSPVFMTAFKATNRKAGKPVTLKMLMDEIDFEKTGSVDLEEYLQDAISYSLVKLTIKGNERTGVIYVFKGDDSNSDSGTEEVIFKDIPVDTKIQKVNTDDNDWAASLRQSSNKRTAAELERERTNIIMTFLNSVQSVTGYLKHEPDFKKNSTINEDSINLAKYLKSGKPLTYKILSDNRSANIRINDKTYNVIGSGSGELTLYEPMNSNKISVSRNDKITSTYEDTDLDLTQAEPASYYEVVYYERSLKSLLAEYDKPVEKEKTSIKSDVLNKLKAKTNAAKQASNDAAKDASGEIRSIDKLYYGVAPASGLTTGITKVDGTRLFDATDSLEVVRSIDRLIYDFIYSYGKNIVDTLSEPKILQAAYKMAFKGFNDNLIKLREEYIAKIEAADSDARIEELAAELERLETKFTKLTQNYNDVISYHGEHSKTFVIKNNTIRFSFDETGNLVEENDDTNLEKPKNSYEGVSGNEISSIDGANKETKALIRGLGKATYTDSEAGVSIVPQLNSFGIQELVDFGSTWNNLAITLQSAMEFGTMVTKMEAMIPAFPEYRELLDRLLDPPATTNQVSQIAKFRQDFSRAYVGIYELVYDPATGVYKFIESTKNNVSAIESQFTDNFTSSLEGTYIGRDEFGNNVLKSTIKNLKTDTLKDRVDFLAAIGVKLSDTTLRTTEAKNVITGRTISAMKNALVDLLDRGIKITNPLGQIKTTEAGNINKILKLESKYSRNNATASMQNAAGKTVYALSLNNLLTISNSYLSDVDTYPTYEDVISQPHMRHLDFRNNPYVKNSVWLNQMFDLDENSSTFGNRKLINGQPVVITLVNFNGLKVENEEGASDGEVTTGLWIGDKLLQDFNSLLTSGVKEMMRAGDKASAFAVRVTGYEQAEGREDKLPVRIEDFAKGYGGARSQAIFGGYLSDELQRMRNAINDGHGIDLDYYNKTAKDFNLFKGILPAKLQESMLADVKSYIAIEEIVSKNQREINQALRDFFNTQVNSKIASFENYQFSLDNPKWIDSDLRAKYNVQQLLRAYVVNAFILNVEQTKVFNGDGAFYKAFHKRNSKDTSTGTTMMTDQWFIDFLNNDPNTNLQAKSLGVTNTVTNITNTVIFKDNVKPSAYIDIYREQLKEFGLAQSEIDSIAEKYKEANEGDAQGWITLDFYRTFKLAQGKWYPQHEAIYQKASRGEQLTRDEIFYFMPIKAQYAGPLQYDGAYAPAFHKYSLVPLLPSVIKGTKMEAMNEKMIRNNVGYGLFESGSKVATILSDAGSKDSFYGDYATRAAVDPSGNFLAINPIFNHYLKEQVNIEPSLHDEVIFGTQFRKLLFQNLFSHGTAIDPKWGVLYAEYSKAIDQLISNEKQRLLEELGIQEDGKGGYKNVDFTKLVDKFVKEAKRRDMNMNVVDFMQYDPTTNDFKYPLDSSINRQQVQSMIMSIVNNRLIRQHTNGDLMVQVSGAGFEKYEAPNRDQVAEYGTNGLRFYHLKDGKTRSMQVKVPLNGDFTNLLYFEHPDGKRIDTLDRLNDALRNEEWVEANRKSIQMVGYRIPTQGLNSIEFMEVAEFLPPEAGNILLLPTEIVIKAGSDFDIDKLSIFKPAIRQRYRPGQNGERIVDRAFYVEPKFLDLTKSVETQKEELAAEYEPAIQDLKDRVSTLRYDKMFSREKYEAVKKSIKERLNIEVNASLDDLTAAEANVRDLDIALSIKKDDLEQARKDAAGDPENVDKADRIARLQFDVQKLVEDIQIAISNREQATEAANASSTAMREAMTEINQIMNGILDDAFADINAARTELNNVRTEYFNKKDDLTFFKKGMQNRIVEIAREVLEDKSNFVQLITPNDTGLIKPMITKEGGIKNKNGYPSKTDYTATSIYIEKTQEEKFLAGLVGKKALGIAAVNNTFTQLFEQIGLQMNKIQNNTKVQMRLLGNRQGDKYDFSNTLDEKGILKSEFISQMINAYVDVLNDDFIFYANAGLEVAPVLFYLKNAGISTEKIFYFINHPAIKYYINNLQATKSFVHKVNDPKTYDQKVRSNVGKDTYGMELYKALTDQLGVSNKKARAYGVSSADSYPNFFNEEFLLSRIDKGIEEISYEERAAVLNHFLEVQREANVLRKFQAANSYDTSTAATPVDALKFGDNEQDVRYSGFIDNEYMEKMSNTVIKPFKISPFIASMFDSLMPVTAGRTVTEFVAENSKAPNVIDSDKYSRVFVNDLMLFVFSNYVKLERLPGSPTPFDYVFKGSIQGSMFDKLVPLNKGGLIARLQNLKTSPNGANLRAQFPIIDQIRILPLDSTSRFANVTIYRGENTTDVQNSLIEQFSRLANFSDPAYTESQQKYIQKVFKDLALFAFVQSGLNKSPISFTDIVPNELYTPLVVEGIKEFGKVLQSDPHILDVFENVFKKNNPDIFGDEPNAIPTYKFKNYRVTARATEFRKPEVAAATAPQTQDATASDIEENNQVETSVVTRTNEIITRKEVRSNYETLYIFGDNRTRKGLGGQAKEMRGEPNAFGIITKAKPARDNDAYLSDDQFEQNKADIDADIDAIIAAWNTGNYKNIVLPPIGVGLAELEKRAPRTWGYLEFALGRLDLLKTIPPQQTRLFYGNLATSQENRILDSRNSDINNEVDDILNQLSEQSKPCNS